MSAFFFCQIDLDPCWRKFLDPRMDNRKGPLNTTYHCYRHDVPYLCFPAISVPWLYPTSFLGGQWSIGRVLDSRPRGRGFEPHWRHCVVSLSKNINPSLVLVQLRKTRPFITWDVRINSNKQKPTSFEYAPNFLSWWVQIVVLRFDGHDAFGSSMGLCFHLTVTPEDTSFINYLKILKKWILEFMVLV